MVSKIVDLFIDSAIEEAKRLRDRYLQEIGWNQEKPQSSFISNEIIRRIDELADNTESSLKKDYQFPYYKADPAFMLDDEFYRFDTQSEILKQILRRENEDSIFHLSNEELREWLKKFVEVNKIIDELPENEKLKIAYGFSHVYENPESNDYYSEVEFKQSLVFRKTVCWISFSWVFVMIDDGGYFFFKHLVTMKVKDEDSQDQIEKPPTAERLITKTEDAATVDQIVKPDSFESLFRKAEDAEKLKTILEENGYTKNGVWETNIAKEIVSAYIAIKPIIHYGNVIDQGTIFVQELGFPVKPGKKGKNKKMTSRSLNPDTPDKKLIKEFEELFSDLLPSR